RHRPLQVEGDDEERQEERERLPDPRARLPARRRLQAPRSGDEGRDRVEAEREPGGVAGVRVHEPDRRRQEEPGGPPHGRRDGLLARQDDRAENEQRQRRDPERDEEAPERAPVPLVVVRVGDAGKAGALERRGRQDRREPPDAAREGDKNEREEALLLAP